MWVVLMDVKMVVVWVDLMVALKVEGKAVTMVDAKVAMMDVSLVVVTAVLKDDW